MYFLNLGDIEDWKWDVYGDAGYKNLPDKMSSCGGRVIMFRITK